jgi:very-short-patch-repair endonuclease
VMMLSTAYGRAATGKLTLNFGPLNMEGGERRLNVLITRARIRCEVFTSLRADDLPSAPDTPRGVRALGDFLRYAATGALASGAGAATAPTMGMEATLAMEIEAMGFEVERRVGSQTCYVDLAIRDPDRPERYLLAVACDGDNYAGARAARDRDRLRAQVLEGLGWRVHRVWSLDWHNRPVAERRRLREAIEAARAEAGIADVRAPMALPPPDEAPAFDRADPVQPLAPAKLAAYEMATPQLNLPAGGLPAMPTNRLAIHVAEVVDVEGPVTTGEVVKRLAQAAGVKRPADKALLSLERAIDHAVKAGLVIQRYDFLWPPTMEVAPVRDRSAIPSAQRKLELIAPEERARAVEKAVADGFGLVANTAAQAAAKLLGYSRPNDDVLDGLAEAVQLAVATGKLVQRGQQLYVVD